EDRGSGLAARERVAERSPVDRRCGVEPRDQAEDECGAAKSPALLARAHLGEVEAALARRHRHASQPREQHDPDREHDDADGERDPWIRGLVHRREVEGSGPRRHREEPDDAAQGGETGAAVALDEAVHHAPYFRARYCSKVVVPSMCAGQRSCPWAICRLAPIGTGMLTTRFLMRRASSHEMARLRKRRTSGPPKSGSMPAGAWMRAATSRAPTSRVSTGWNCQPAGMVATNGMRAYLEIQKSIRVWNCVARSIDHGTMFSRTICSAASF